VRTRSFVIFFVVAVVSAFASTPANADAIDFNATGPGGFIWFGTGPITATAQTVTGQYLPGGSPINLTNAVLSFTTGSLHTGLGSPSWGVYSFNQGGSIAVSNYFSGQFTSAQLLASAGGYMFYGSFVAGILTQGVPGFTGVLPSNAVGLLSANFTPDAVTPGKYNWASGHLTITPTPVPEPSALLLLGIGLIVLAVLTKRTMVSATRASQ
jgi:hypothetical protein